MFTTIDIEEHKEDQGKKILHVLNGLLDGEITSGTVENTLEVMIDQLKFGLDCMRYMTCFREVLNDVIGEETALKLEELADKKYMEYMKERNS